MSNTNYFGVEIVCNLLLAITLRAGGKGSTRFQAFELSFRTVKVKANLQDQ